MLLLQTLHPSSTGGGGFNKNIVNYQEVYYDFNEETRQIDTTYGDNRSVNPGDGMRRFNSRQNFYFKPIVTVRDVWSISNRSTLTTTAYASFGRGGGEGLNTTSGTSRMTDGTLNLQGTWDSHQLFEFGPNGLNVDSIGREGIQFHSGFLTTITVGSGALSNFNTQLSDEWTWKRQHRRASTLEAIIGPLWQFYRSHVLRCAR